MKSGNVSKERGIVLLLCRTPLGELAVLSGMFCGKRNHWLLSHAQGQLGSGEDIFSSGGPFQ